MSPPAPAAVRSDVASEPADEIRAFADDVRDGLMRTPKTLSCRYFYDALGSRLFEAICETPEYYLTRAEHDILRAHANEIAALLPRPIDLVELGSGNARKTRLLVESLLRRQADLLYVPVDISRAALADSTAHLTRDFPALRITPLAAEYREGLRHMALMRRKNKLVLWLGSNIGNFERAEAVAFLGVLRDTLGANDRLLLGIDLRKDRGTLLAAYDDAAGVTARFNRNILTRINRELGGRFDPTAFHHRVSWDEARGAMDMFLVSARPQRVGIEALGREVSFGEAEAIHTESSFKYSDDEIAALIEASGFRLAGRWLDTARRFAVVLLAPA